MKKLLENEIDKQIVNALKYNDKMGRPFNQFKLPQFLVRSDGAMVFNGVAAVSSLADYAKFTRNANEVYDRLRSAYKMQIARSFRYNVNSLIAALNSFTLESDGFALAANLQNRFTTATVQSADTEAYRRNIDVLTQAAYGARYLQRGADVDFNQKSNRDFAVLPLLTANGLLLFKNSYNQMLFEPRFAMVPLQLFEAYCNYLRQSARQQCSDDATRLGQLNAEIANLAKECRQLGEAIEAGMQDDLPTRLEKLAFNFGCLLGYDLSPYAV